MQPQPSRRHGIGTIIINIEGMSMSARIAHIIYSDNSAEFSVQYFTLRKASMETVIPITGTKTH